MMPTDTTTAIFANVEKGARISNELIKHRKKIGNAQHSVINRSPGLGMSKNSSTWKNIIYQNSNFCFWIEFMKTLNGILGQENKINAAEAKLRDENETINGAIGSSVKGL